MKLDSFGDMPDKNWFQKLLELTRRRISFDDNIDGIFLTKNIGVAETRIGHNLGRIPKYIFEVAAYPNGTAGIQFTKPSTVSEIFLTRTAAGKCTLFII